MAEGFISLFRKEAVDHHTRQRSEGDLLRISPRWTRWAYWLLVGVFGAAALFAALGHIHEYAAGPAVIRLEGRAEVVATSAAVVASVDVHPGQHVAQGDTLVRVYLAAQVEELQRTNPQFDLALRAERSASETGGAAEAPGERVLRAQRDIAEARLVAHYVRAPRDGVVGEIRVHAGQYVAPGDVVGSLIADGARFSVVGVLPGHYRPLLHPGMTLRLDLAGFPYQYRYLVINAIDNRVLGPAEVRRSLGLAIGDAVPVDGPAVVIHARLPDDSFVFDGRALRYSDGMPGVVEARVRTESILLTLIPGLRALFRPLGG